MPKEKKKIKSKPLHPTADLTNNLPPITLARPAGTHQKKNYKDNMSSFQDVDPELKAQADNHKNEGERFIVASCQTYSQ
jgi:hypothetical protein